MAQNLSDKNSKINADDIRDYCIENCIIPARTRDEKQVAICVGDICKELGFKKNKDAHVDDAIGANKFLTLANVKRISRSGPPHSPTAVYTFQLL